jgi:AraC-like DNA-binding protein
MDKRIAFLKKQILSNLQHSPTIEQMARSVNLSESYLLWLFKKEVGMSPVQYLKHLRLEKARKLLEESFMRVQEIGWAVGVSDKSHFVLDFKREFGTTPTKYRKQHWTKIENEESYANES